MILLTYLSQISRQSSEPLDNDHPKTKLVHLLQIFIKEADIEQAMRIKQYHDAIKIRYRIIGIRFFNNLLFHLIKNGKRLASLTSYSLYTKLF